MPKFKYEKLAKYPHLRPEETKIWERFIKNNPNFFDEVMYDVRVGEGREYPESEMPQVKEAMEYLSKKRIDVVGFISDEIYVIEIKPKANLSAVGQALGLAELFREVTPLWKRVIPTIITDQILPDMEALCSKMGVRLLLA